MSPVFYNNPGIFSLLYGGVEPASCIRVDKRHETVAILNSYCTFYGQLIASFKAKYINFVNQTTVPDNDMKVQSVVDEMYSGNLMSFMVKTDVKNEYEVPKSMLSYVQAERDRLEIES